MASSECEYILYSTVHMLYRFITRLKQKKNKKNSLLTSLRGLLGSHVRMNIANRQHYRFPSLTASYFVTSFSAIDHVKQFFGCRYSGSCPAFGAYGCVAIPFHCFYGIVWYRRIAVGSVGTCPPTKCSTCQVFGMGHYHCLDPRLCPRECGLV